MKILMLVDNLDIGGTETHILSISKDLISRKQEVIVATQSGVLVDRFNKNNIKTLCIDFNEENIIKLIKTYCIDVVHCHLIKSMKLMSNVYMLIKIPYIITLHGLFYIKEDLNKFCENASHIIAVSEAVKMMLLNAMQNDISYKVSVLYNTFNLNLHKISNIDIRKLLNLEANEKIIVYCSRLSEAKGLLAKRFIHVFYNLATKYNDIHAIVIGDGPKKKELDFYAKSLNSMLNRKCIHIVGAQEDVISFYNNSLFVVGTGRVAIEAMSCKKPVIAMGIKSLEGLVSSDSAKQMIETYFGDHGNSNGKTLEYLQSVMEYLITNDNICEELGYWSYNWSLQNFDYNKYTNDLVTIYSRTSFL